MPVRRDGIRRYKNYEEYAKALEAAPTLHDKNGLQQNYLMFTRSMDDNTKNRFKRESREWLDKKPERDAARVESMREMGLLPALPTPIPSRTPTPTAEPTPTPKTKAEEDAEYEDYLAEQYPTPIPPMPSPRELPNPYNGAIPTPRPRNSDNVDYSGVLSSENVERMRQGQDTWAKRDGVNKALEARGYPTITPRPTPVPSHLREQAATEAASNAFAESANRPKEFYNPTPTPTPDPAPMGNQIINPIEWGKEAQAAYDRANYQEPYDLQAAMQNSEDPIRQAQALTRFNKIAKEKARREKEATDAEKKRIEEEDKASK
jgi:hypothetical protein